MIFEREFYEREYFRARASFTSASERAREFYERENFERARFRFLRERERASYKIERER